MLCQRSRANNVGGRQRNSCRSRSQLSKHLGSNCKRLIIRIWTPIFVMHFALCLNQVFISLGYRIRSPLHSCCSVCFAPSVSLQCCINDFRHGDRGLLFLSFRNHLQAYRSVCEKLGFIYGERLEEEKPTTQELYNIQTACKASSS